MYFTIQYNAGLVHFISVSLVQVAAIILETFFVAFKANYFSMLFLLPLYHESLALGIIHVN